LARHFIVIDADAVYHRLLQPGNAAHTAVLEHFDVQNDDGTINRAKLGAEVFADEHKRRLLNRITHRLVLYEMFKRVLYAWITGERVIVLDIPLLMEGGLDKWMGCVVLVDCDPSTQLQRLLSRNPQLTREQALQRIQSQLPLEHKRKRADYILDNRGTVEELEVQVDHVVSRLQQATPLWWVRLCQLPPVGVVTATLTLFYRFFFAR
jgi:dephospho-CoA kinase